MKKYLWWLVIAVVVGGVLWLSLSPRVIDVEVATAGRGPMKVTVDEEGETRLRRRFVVSAPVAGRVLRIESRPGDVVKAGAPLAVIQPAAPAPLDARTQATGEARVNAAEAATGRARADEQRLAVEFKQAEADAARAKQLFDTGYGPREIFEQADARARGLREAAAASAAATRAAEFELAAARAALVSRGEAASGRAVTITAPIAGVILKRMQESEAVVLPGVPLIEMGNLDDLEIVSDLLSTDAVRVRSGAAVTIERWGGEGTLAGRVQRIEPAGFMKISALGVEEQRVNVVIDFVDPRERRASLGDGFRVEVRIVVWEKADALTVPTSSLFRLSGDWAVFTVESDVLRRKTLKIGQRNDQLAEVLEGLAPGERVVAYPGESLMDGARVRLR
ncbi:MAG TPA: efflux RND transporter periplasmic adaptor subunit [Vicinamibacterales bacterium]|nr:efflux RND transporter periplasmic adaptor subunit [Vicinamibacterales bacterium]